MQQLYPTQGKNCKSFDQDTILDNNPLSGFEAFQTCIERIAPNGGTIWLKVGHNRFLTAEINPNGQFPIHWTKLETKGDSLSRVKSKGCPNAYQTISEFCNANDGGAFYVQGKPIEYPLKEFCLESNDVGAEMDDGTTEEQWGRINEFISGSGLVPDLVISSGGKSLHPHWRLDKDLPTAQVVALKRLLAIALIGDPAVVNPHQPMRIAGFDRKEKNSHQALLSHSDCKYTYDEFIDGFKRYFASVGWEFPEIITDDWWRDNLRSVIVTTNKSSYEEKREQLKQALAVGLGGYQAIKEKKIQEREFKQQNRQFYGTTGQTDLVKLINEVGDRLGSDAFDWSGHQWQWSGDKARGYCPWHDSSSGTSGWIAPKQTGEGWGYACAVCTDNRQINAFTYDYYLKHGLEVSLTGKDFVEAAKSFLSQHGVDVSETQWGDSSEDSKGAELKRIEAYKAMIKGIYEKANSICRIPDLIVNEPFLTPEIANKFPKKGLIFVSSPKASRKSQTIKAEIKKARIEGHPVISIVPRILLGKDQVKWGIQYIDTTGRMSYNEYETISLCFDSIWKICGRDWAGALVIFDEVRQGIKHLLTASTLTARRPFVLKVLEEKLTQVIETGGKIIAADADITEVEIDYLEKLTQTRAWVLHNEFIPERGKVTFTTGLYDETIDAVECKLKQGQNILIFCTSKKDSKALADRLGKITDSSKIRLVNGDTSEDKATKHFIEQGISKSIKQQKPRVLIYTTSMSTGVSHDGYIDNVFDEAIHSHFNYGFVIAHAGILEPEEITQAMLRNRSKIDFLVWAGKGKILGDDFRSCNPEVLKNQFYKKTDSALNLMAITTEVLEEKLGREPTHLEVYQELIKKVNPETGMTEDINLETYCRIKARANYAARNFEELLRDQLIQEGYEIREQKNLLITNCGQEHREQKKENDLTEATEIAEAGDIDLEEAQEIKNSRSSTKEERYQAAKAFLTAELPGVELTPEFIYKATIKDYRRWLNAQQLYWFVKHPEIAKELDTAKYLQKIKQFANGVIFLPDIKSKLPAIKKIIELGILDLFEGNGLIGSPDSGISEKSPEVVKFMKKAYSHRNQIYTALGLTVTNKTKPIQFIDRLLGRIGLGLVNTSVEVSENGKIRYYSINPSVLNDPDRLAVWEAFNTRFLGEKNPTTKTAKIQTDTDFGLGQHAQKGLYIKGKCCPKISAPQTEKKSSPEPHVEPLPINEDKYSKDEEDFVDGFDDFVDALNQTNDRGFLDGITDILKLLTQGDEVSYLRHLNAALRRINDDVRRRIDGWAIA